MWAFAKEWQRGCIIETESFGCHDNLAERSKAVAQGAIPKWRGFEPHSCHFSAIAAQCAHQVLSCLSISAWLREFFHALKIFAVEWNFAFFGRGPLCPFPEND